MGESRCSIGCADGYFPSTPPAACVDTGIPSAWQTAGYADCAAMAASFGCGFDGTVGGVAVPLGPVGTVLSDICTVTCGACPVAAAPMDDDTWCAHSIFHPSRESSGLLSHLYPPCASLTNSSSTYNQ